ncbi:hypothetical protein IB265_32980 [Ensifer sp. ENS10]|uniref:hypothetical protein n=1 Tax=Ensifer sp. ENS10 TaxID=2769286 RepID=UPI0017873D31|nr:hypothetical protein [Ensifer sp. ENS10]MBD9511572.1 hypothetical protein [Ensifer sp. ENS10]
MSSRLVKQIAEMGKSRHTRPVIVYMKSGRSFEGNLGTIDVPNGTVEIEVKDGISHKIWTVLVGTESIEAVSPRWEKAA